MILEYIKSAMKNARYEILEDHTFYGEIRDFQGVYANEPTLEGCREELESTLEDWLLFSLVKNLPIPEVDGKKLQVKRSA
ncbi:MAG: hypothetical protein AAGU19_12095 [Prolixibacteraceae bacterium]